MSRFVKVLCAGLAVSLVVSLSACGSQNPASTDTKGTTTQAAETKAEPKKEEAAKAPVKLKLLTLSADENRNQIMDKFIKANYQKDLPGVEIEFEPGGGGADYNNKVKAYNSSGDMPDVFWSLADFATPIINAGNMLDLTPYISKDGFLDKFAVKDALKFKDGKIYTVSSGSDTYFNPRIFYNKDIFEKNNIQVPKNFGEFLDAAKKLGAAGITPLTTDGKDGFIVFYFLFQNMVQLEDPQVMADLMNNKTDFNNPVILKALKNIETMVKSGVFPKGIANLDYGPAIESFKAKKAAMYIMGTWELPGLAADANVDIMQWPQVNPAVDPNSVVQFWGSPLNGYAVSSKSKNVEAAVKLAEFCAASDAKYFAEQKAPIALDIGVKLEGASPVMQRNLDWYNGAKTKIGTFAFNAVDAKAAAEFGKLSAQLLTGQYTAEQFVKDYNKIWQENTWFKN